MRVAVAPLELPLRGGGSWWRAADLSGGGWRERATYDAVERVEGVEVDNREPYDDLTTRGGRHL
jgi:hypothetical protein